MNISLPFFTNFNCYSFLRQAKTNTSTYGEHTAKLVYVFMEKK